MSRSEFRFVVDGVDLTTEQQTLISREIQKAGLAASYQEAVGPNEVELPKCAIRRTCRWFAEQGPAACPACSYVITDNR